MPQDAKIRLLKAQGLSWLTIDQQFPGRSPVVIAARYHGKLKANPSHGALQLCDDSQTPLVLDDSDEEEWEVEEICDNREDDGVLESFVKWKGRDETWEPFENVEETGI